MLTQAPRASSTLGVVAVASLLWTSPGARAWAAPPRARATSAAVSRPTTSTRPGAAAAASREVTQLRAGHEAFRGGDYRAAVAALAPVASTRGALGAHALYFLAESEQQLGDAARAAAHFTELAKRNAGVLSQVALWRAADARWTAGDRAGAANAYRALLTPGKGSRRGPAGSETPKALPAVVDPVPARLHLAEHLIATGRATEARRWLDEIVVQAPEHPLAATAAKLRADRPRTVPADAATHASVAPEERLRRAEVQAAARDYAAAAAELEAIPPEAPEALRIERDLALGMVLYRMRSDYPRSSKLLLGVFERLHGERAASAAFHGARALSRAHRDDEAIAGYRVVIARFPHTRHAAEAQFLSGWLEVNRGHFRAGLADLRATVEHYGRSEFAEDAAWFLALCHLLLDEPAEALVALDRFTAIAKRGKGAYEAELRADYFRARALTRLARREEATLRLHALARRAPFHYYGLLAAARLRETGAPVPFDLPVPRGEASSGPTLGQSARGLPPGSAARDLPSGNASRDLGETDGPAPSLPPSKEPVIVEADALLAAGFDVEAGRWLERAEPALLRRLGARALPVLLPRYARMALHDRAYRLAELKYAATLREPPTGEARAIWEAAYPRAFAAEVTARAGEVPPSFLWSIMRKESGFDPLVVSYADARGLLQMLPETTAGLAAKEGAAFFPDELFVPAANIRWGATFIGSLWRSFGADPLVTAGAYNGGPKAMSRWCAQNGQRPTDEFVELVTFEQSREYIKRVAGIYARYQYLYTGRPWQLTIGPGCRQAPPAPAEEAPAKAAPATATPPTATPRKAAPATATPPTATPRTAAPPTAAPAPPVRLPSMASVAKIRGTLRRSDLEGGHMQLVAEDGTTYEVEGSDPLLSRDGLRVEVEGTIDRGAFSIAMTGPRLKVKSVRALP